MQTVLAYRRYPAPEGTVYYAGDLDTPEKVIVLFDYCQILEAIIYKSGWIYLIDTFGYEKLFEMNNKSGWMDVERLDEFIADVEQALRDGDECVS